MSQVYGCRNSTPGTCRTREIQQAVLRSTESVGLHLTTRLSERKMPEMALGALTTHSGIIKGLFVLPDAKNAACIDAQPIIVLGKPFARSTKTDIEHADIAKAASLLHYQYPSREEQERTSDATPTLVLAKGFWGFVLSKVRFRQSTTQRTEVVFDSGGGHTFTLGINTEKNPGIIDPQTGTINLRSIRTIEPETAKLLWANNVHAFLFRAGRDEDTDVWAVRATSGLKGDMPPQVLSPFLLSLACHAAPEFRVFQFLQFDGTLMKNAIRVSWNQVVHPTCLSWPEGSRLIEDPSTPPPEWQGE